MKTRLLHVNGREYIYAYDSIYIAQGKSVQLQRSLGPAKALVSRAAKEASFREFVQAEEIQWRLLYWKKRIRDPAFAKHISLEKIETLRSKVYRAKMDMGLVAAQLMENAFLVDFIYNSNRLEGSKIPRIRVQQEVQEKAKPKGEVANTLRALQEVNGGFRFRPKNIVALHGILLAHEPEKLGLRTDRVIVGNAEVAPWQEVEPRLRELCTWYEKQRKIMYPLELAFDFYYQFERIHPFEDGNGRTGRLLMNRILKDQKYHPMIISWKRKGAQEHAFAKRMEGRKEAFYDFMKEEFVKTHEIYMGKIDTALNAERLTKVFLEPSPSYE